MGLQDILQKILDDASNFSKNALESAKKEIEKIFLDIEEKISEKKNDQEKNFNKKSSGMRKKVENLVTKEFKNKIANEKRKLIIESIELAKKNIFNISKEEKVSIFTSFLKKISENSGKIVPAIGSEQFVQEALRAVNKNFEVLPAKFKNELGFVFVSKKLEISFLFSEILEKEIVPKLDFKISEILFSENVN